MQKKTIFHMIYKTIFKIPKNRHETYLLVYLIILRVIQHSRTQFLSQLVLLLVPLSLIILPDIRLMYVNTLIHVIRLILGAIQHLLLRRRVMLGKRGHTVSRVPAAVFGYPTNCIRGSIVRKFSRKLVYCRDSSRKMTPKRREVHFERVLSVNRDLYDVL